MALPKDVQDAVSRVDRSLREWRICQSPWQIISAHLLSQAAELKILRVKCSGTLANNLCQDHRDKQVGNPCLACTIEKLQSGLAAADALLRDIKDWDVNQAQGAYLMVPLNLRKRIQAHLSENADVQP